MIPTSAPGEAAASARGRAAVVGTRGVPARYGGFETLAEQLALQIDAADVVLDVYGQRSAYSEDERRGPFNGHNRFWLPFQASGGQSLIHDALQLFHAAFIRRHTEILLLGTSAAWLLPFVRIGRRKLRLVTNIDGLEWRREKFGPFGRTVLKMLEALAVRFSDAIIADNGALVPLVREIHGIEPVMIAYGADQVADETGSDANGYLLAIARVEPENNTEMILEAALAAGTPIVFLGNWDANDYGRAMLPRFSEAANITLHKAVYEQSELTRIRSGSAAYVHGHSVGGTNPSLLEALVHSERILAYDCVFNRATLDEEGAYFRSAAELATMMRDPSSGFITPARREELKARYRWSAIAGEYLAVLGLAPGDSVRGGSAAGQPAALSGTAAGSTHAG